MEKKLKKAQVEKRWPFVFRPSFNEAYPTAASRTTVTGTFSFFKASAICRLSTRRKYGLIQRACVLGGCEDAFNRQRPLTRLSQAATQSHKRRSVSSLPLPFPAPWGRLWSTSESGFSEQIEKKWQAKLHASRVCFYCWCWFYGLPY